MANHIKVAMVNAITTLKKLGWPKRRIARELQSRIQARRKEMDLEVVDRITVVVSSDSDEIGQVLTEFGTALAEEVQANSLTFAKNASVSASWSIAPCVTVSGIWSVRVTVIVAPLCTTVIAD